MDDPFECRCKLGCKSRATQEDMRCDTCRKPDHFHLSAAPLGTGFKEAGWIDLGVSFGGLQTFTPIDEPPF